MQTIILLVLVLVNFARAAELFPVLESLQLGKVVFFIGFFALLMLPRGHVTEFYDKSKIFRLTLLLYIVCIVSIPFSIWRGGAIDEFVSFSKMYFICILSIIFAANIRLSQFRFSLFASIAFLVVGMLLQESSLRLSVSHTYDSNDMGVLLLTFLPILLAEVLKGHKLLRLGYAALAVGVLYCVVLTGSRGAIVALSMQALYFVYASKRYRVVAICSVIIVSFVVATVAHESLWERFQLLSLEGDQADYNLTDSSGRLAIWKNGLEIFVHNPILGVGIGQFGTALYYLDGRIGLTAHNTYLQIATELGFFGFILFLTLIKVAWQSIGKYESECAGAESTRWFAVKIGMVGLLVGIFFISSSYSAIVHYFFGLVSVMCFLQKKTPSC